VGNAADPFLRLPDSLDAESIEAWRQFVAAPQRSRELADHAFRAHAGGWAGLCLAYHQARGAEVEAAQGTLRHVGSSPEGAADARVTDLAKVLDGYVDIVRGREEEAVARLERLAAAQATGATAAAPLDRFLVYHGLALAYGRLGQLERVLQHHYANVTLLERCGSPPALAVVLHNLSGTLGAVDDWEEAFAAATRAVRCCAALDNEILMRRAEINLALTCRFSGRIPEALAILRRLREKPLPDAGSDFALFVNSAEALAMSGQLGAARDCLKQARGFASPIGDAHRQANCEWIAGLIAARSGDATAAIAHLETARQAVSGLKPVHIPILPRIVEQLAACYAQAGDHERAFATYQGFHEVFEARRGYTTRARTFGRQSRDGVSSIESALQQHGAGPDSPEPDERTRLNEALRRALSSAHRDEHDAAAGWTARSIDRVRSEARGLGVDAARVGGLIANLDRTSAGPSPQDPPPAVEVSVLGRFEIRIDGEPLRFGRKAPARPLALLKYLAAHADRRPAETEVADALWPDQDGDAALRSLAVNLHRLRRLLGSAATVVHHDRRIALDARYVRCDAHAFERLLDQAAMAGREDERMRFAERALALYAGDFLAGEEDPSWMLPVRNRLRLRFVATCAAQGAALAAAGEMERARAFYQRGLRVDEGVEELCLGVMRCSLALGQSQPGIAAYRALEEALARRSHARPAAAIEALYGKLLTEAT
jgi:DNA-binding SARP family transcriptional activator/tetratricopeptide (TPR) repeat protein